MTKHIRANLLLFGLSIGICCIAYPLVLLAVGWALFPSNAEGSLIRIKGPDGTERVVGSRLIAQPFTANEYFWPRPSAASYNGATAGGSNWGASQPKLRDRAAQQLGGMVVYKVGSKSAGPDANKPRTPQDDIAAWAAQRKLSAKYLALVYSTLNEASAGHGYLKQIGQLWDTLPAPNDGKSRPRELESLQRLIEFTQQQLCYRDENLIQSNAGNWPIAHLAFRTKVTQRRDQFDPSQFKSSRLLRSGRLPAAKECADHPLGGCHDVSRT